MDVTAFKEAQEAYSRGDYAKALEGFTVCAQDTGDLSAADLSKFYHLIGNCYIKNGEPANAAQYYKRALENSSKSRRPALFVNLGTALLNSKDYTNALKAFESALNYNAYATPYRAYSGIGAAQLKLGNTTEAGAAYREAALDPTNPMPAKALVNLGVCFMELGRSADAVVSYETALDFDLDPIAEAKAKSNLGQAYMAEGRVQKAIDAFESATASGVYELTPMARHDYEIARKLKDRLDGKIPGILNTGFIPKLSLAPDGLDGFESAAADPFAPRSAGEENVDVYGATEAFTPVPFDEQEPADEFAPAPQSYAEPADEQVPEQNAEDEESEQVAMGAHSVQDNAPEDFASAETVAFTPVETNELPIDDGVSSFTSTALPAAGAEQADPSMSAEIAFAELDKEEDALPSPEDTQFFDLTEKEINTAARDDIRKARKRRGVGLKVAIVVVVICILLAAAACAAYLFGYGFPTQETVTENFFTAVQSGESTDQYWADNVEENSRSTQTAALHGITSHEIDAVKRSMSQTAVYVKATLEEGGEVYYEVVLGRSGIGWSVQYVELYFPSEQ